MRPDPGAAKGDARFVIQKHEATRLHFDFRLEIGGVLVSWAVPKGLPLKHGEKRLAVKVEDHPVSYFDFEGTIPKGQYGGGTVMVWDTGTWTAEVESPAKELEGGKLHFTLQGSKLSGEWYLVQLRGGEEWLIIRGGEDHPAISKKVADTSVMTGRSMKDITAGSETSAASNTTGNGDSMPRKNARKKTRRASKKVSATGTHTILPLEDLDFIEPMKARLETEAPEVGRWGYELKFDGFRALAWKRGLAVALVSRTRHSLTEKFPEIAGALSRLKGDDFIMDGEIVALDPQGRSSFQLLQAYELGQERPPLYFYVFDLLENAGKTLIGETLEKRKAQLKKLVPASGSLVRISAILGEEAAPLLTMAQQHGLEGLIGKRLGSPYEAGRRSGAWIKLKLLQAQEFVIGGYTEPTGTRAHLGALLVGFYKDGKLCYAGKVGTGFNTVNLADLREKLAPLTQDNCPFPDLPEERAGRFGQGITSAIMKRCHWVKPRLVAQVKFSEWTREGRLRQPVYLGLRPDKKAASVIREPILSHAR